MANNRSQIIVPVLREAETSVESPPNCSGFLIEVLTQSTVYISMDTGVVETNDGYTAIQARPYERTGLIPGTQTIYLAADSSGTPVKITFYCAS